MSTAGAPEWLEAFQARFSAMLRTPLDRSTGTLRDQASRYPAELCDEALAARALGAAERLAVYNRQYWFRLFSVMQSEYRLTARLLGAWSFNELAASFLEANPPRERDLGCAGDGFVAFLDSAVPLEGSRAVRQAARIDDAFRSVFRAPFQPAFAPTAADVARLSSARLQWSDAVRLVEEDWPLLQLREQPDPGERAVALPEPHATTRHWAICRTNEGQRRAPLEPLQAKLMRLLYDHPLDVALAQLEREQPNDQAGRLAAQTQRWFAQGVRLGFWTGIAP